MSIRRLRKDRFELAGVVSEVAEPLDVNPPCSPTGTGIKRSCITEIITYLDLQNKADATQSARQQK